MICDVNNRRIMYGVSIRKIFEMASKNDLDFSYTTIDEIFPLSIGEMTDYSGTRFDGDFSMTLEEGQKKKHAFIADSLGIKNNTKVLDMECGWGWANAKTTLLDVIQNSGKSLMPYDQYHDAFNGNPANEYNSESLFELNIDPDAI